MREEEKIRVFNSLMPKRLHIGTEENKVTEKGNEFIQDTISILVVCAGILAALYFIQFWR